VRALTPGRDTFPRDAARAQADYDCWMLNATVPSQAQAAAQCRHSLDATLPRLENEVHATADTPASSPDASPAPTAPPAPTASPAPRAAPPAPEPTPAQPPAPQSSTQPPSYTVTFALNSAELTALDMDVLRRAIADARSGGQPKIELVGHTDTSGSDEYNMRLSVKRAEAVRDALVSLGARREAIATSGVGESDLAVPTADGVREPRNRRAVVSLTI